MGPRHEQPIPINNPQPGDDCRIDPQPHVTKLPAGGFTQYTPWILPSRIRTASVMCPCLYNSFFIAVYHPSHYVNIPHWFTLGPQLMTIWLVHAWAMVPKDVMNILTGVSQCPESSSLLSPRNHWLRRHVCLSVVDTAELFPRWCQSELQPWVLNPGAPVTPSLSQRSSSGVYPFLMGA